MEKYLSLLHRTQTFFEYRNRVARKTRGRSHQTSSLNLWNLHVQVTLSGQEKERIFSGCRSYLNRQPDMSFSPNAPLQNYRIYLPILNRETFQCRRYRCRHNGRRYCHVFCNAGIPVSSSILIQRPFPRNKNSESNYANSVKRGRLLRQVDAAMSCITSVQFESLKDADIVIKRYSRTCPLRKRIFLN